MKSKIISPPIALIISLIFYVASAVVIWKIIEDGSTAQRTISAIGFALAGVIWTIILIRGSSRSY
ncbi:MAG: hypothetical protein AMJ46_13045 [Latescibacteria bacterium DG_63]|nr:MAG: hypothetical protein AMJ46_13045 [Latescibacteria bacterium DG_63]